MNLKGKILRNIFLAAMLIGFVVMYVRSINIPTEDIQLVRSDRIDMSQGWYNVRTGEPVSDQVMTVAPGGDLQITNTLPDTVKDGEVLLYHDYGFRAVVYVDGEEVFQRGKDIRNHFGQEVGAVWVMVPMTPEYAGKTIYLFFQNDTDHSLILNLNHLHIANSSDAIITDIITNVPVMLIATAFIIVAIWLLASTLTLKQAEYMNLFGRMIPLGTLTFFTALWILTNSSLSQVFFHNASVSHSLNYICFFMLPLLLAMFFKGISTNSYRQKLFDYLILSYEIGTLICTILHMLDIVPYSQSIFLGHVYLVVVSVSGFISRWSEYMTVRTHVNHWSLIGCLFAVFASTAAVIGTYFYGSAKVIIFVGVGYFVFLILMMYSQYVYLHRFYIKEKNTQIYNQRAKIDPVIGGISRQGLEMILMDLEHAGKNDPWFLDLDMVNFAAVASQLNWDVEEELLRGIYGMGDAMLGDGEYMAYLGDAHFAFILAPERDVDNLCIRLTQSLAAYLKENWQTIFLYPRFVATYIRRGDKLGKLVSCCRLAYTSGRGRFERSSACYYYTGLSHDEMYKAQLLENELNRAVVNRDFEIMLQSEITTDTSKLVQAKIHFVWNQVIQTAMDGYFYIPADDKGTLDRLMDSAQMANVVAYMNHRRETGAPDIRISVGISEGSISTETFLDSCLMMIYEAGLPLDLFDFELPESINRGNGHVIEKIIERIHEAGATVSLGDFGVDNSNFDSISRFHIDTVKLSPFVTREEGVDHPLTISYINAVVGLIHQAGAKVCCTGVDSLTQYMTLRKMSIDSYSGFYIEEPIPIDVYITK